MYDKWTVQILVILCILLFVGCKRQTGDIRTHTETRSVRQQLAPSQEIIIHFTGTVKSVELLGKEEIVIIPVQFDPKWALTVHIDSVQEEKVPFEPGTTKIFGIHSPTKLFVEHGDKRVGKTYDFEIIWIISPENEWGFRNLEAKTLQ